MIKKNIFRYAFRFTIIGVLSPLLLVLIWLFFGKMCEFSLFILTIIFILLWMLWIFFCFVYSICSYKKMASGKTFLAILLSGIGVLISIRIIYHLIWVGFNF